MSQIVERLCWVFLYRKFLCFMHDHIGIRYAFVSIRVSEFRGYNSLNLSVISANLAG